MASDNIIKEYQEETLALPAGPELELEVARNIGPKRDVEYYKNLQIATVYYNPEGGPEIQNQIGEVGSREWRWRRVIQLDCCQCNYWDNLIYKRVYQEDPKVFYKDEIGFKERHGHYKDCYKVLPRWSRNITAAVKLLKKYSFFQILKAPHERGYEVGIQELGNGYLCLAEGRTVSEAACRAALKYEFWRAEPEHSK